jgi:hypothetical protein
MAQLGHSEPGAGLYEQGPQVERKEKIRLPYNTLSHASLNRYDRLLQG